MAWLTSYLPQLKRKDWLDDIPASPELTAEQAQLFERDGWIGSFPFLTSSTVKRLSALHDNLKKKFAKAEKSGKRPWEKSAHSLVPEFYDIACHPAIVNRLVPLMGPDIMAWGVNTILLQPGKKHRWHVDVEHRHWQGVSVYIGLRNMSRKSTLKVISGSHVLPEAPQELGIASDEEALKAASEGKRSCELSVVDLQEGEFFIFSGRLWHGSENADVRPRTAMLIQYSAPDQRIEVPANYDEPITWVNSRPPCILVNGEDRFGINRLIARP